MSVKNKNLHLIDKLSKQLNVNIPNFKTITIDGCHEIGVWVNSDLTLDTSRIWFNNSENNCVETIQVDRKGNVLEKIIKATYKTVPDSFKEISTLKKSSNIKLLMNGSVKNFTEVYFSKNDSEWCYKSKNKKDNKRKYKLAIRQEYRDVWRLYRPYSIKAHYNDKTLEGFYCTYNILSKKGYAIIKNMLEDI